MTNFSPEQEEIFDREYKRQQSYDKRISLLKEQNEVLLSLLKEAQTEIEWASSEMKGREPDHWKDVRNKLRIYIEDLEK